MAESEHEMATPAKYAHASRGWMSRVPFNEDQPDHVLLSKAQTEALLAIASAIDRLADVMEKNQQP